MICDDYNWSGAKMAVEEFAKEKGIDFEASPYAQAYFKKP